MTGPIAEAERNLHLHASGLMLLIVVPVIFLTLLVAWRYRATGGSDDYAPEWDRSRMFEIIVWGIPAVMIGILSTMVWDKTHALNPYKTLPGATPMKIEAIAFDWKWLFVYPDLGIATVNEVAFPAGTPVTFLITSDVALNSFMIPALGGQIYAMAGMETRLNLQANAPGRMHGRNMQFNGDGFARQTFDALAMDDADFQNWVADARASGKSLDATELAALRKPSVAEPTAYFASVPAGFFSAIINSHASAHPHEMAPSGENSK